jgi:hypothetical protein
MAKTFDERELSPIFADVDPVVQQVLGKSPSPLLLQKLEKRKNLRSHTEQPAKEQRTQAKEKSLIVPFPL